MFVSLVGMAEPIVVMPAAIQLKKKSIIGLKNCIVRQRKGKKPMLRLNEEEDLGQSKKTWMMLVQHPL